MYWLCAGGVVSPARAWFWSCLCFSRNNKHHFSALSRQSKCSSIVTCLSYPLLLLLPSGHASSEADDSDYSRVVFACPPLRRLFFACFIIRSFLPSCSDTNTKLKSQIFSLTQRALHFTSGSSSLGVVSYAVCHKQQQSRHSIVPVWYNSNVRKFVVDSRVSSSPWSHKCRYNSVMLTFLSLSLLQLYYCCICITDIRGKSFIFGFGPFSFVLFGLSVSLSCFVRATRHTRQQSQSDRCVSLYHIISDDIIPYIRVGHHQVLVMSISYAMIRTKHFEDVLGWRTAVTTMRAQGRGGDPAGRPAFFFNHKSRW